MEILAGPKAEQLVHDVLAGCTKEFLVARSAPEPMEGAAHRVTDLLQRGIDVRALFHHTARTPPAVRDYARTVTERGARLRTVQCVPGEFAVVDRRLVLLGHMSGSTCLISEQSIVDHFTRVFEHLWEGGWALPAVITRHPDPARPAEADPKPAILRLLSEGATDEQVARALGLSLRTCRRHIADVMSQVGAVGRFQAGVRTARYGLLGMPPVPDDAGGAK
ncbi:winged helix-turn-helix domain-containing protein [Streptomyces sp. CA-210063]|uniref:winged helix-turn-helix domain-containing protein n=1 Tax=Streptomyces sp. CA-210063 TaxID=2801029 RepID=UPI00214C4700|nr:winged helix-turn-helix domain-containing protein [Streptomyces sp. CA-210063]UUU30035.1 winged helix-turn-helix domain-containing protein [Streptomyces sp. CA-210063]